MNEIANLSERLGVDIENVRLGIGADTRIGFHFIYPGCGYGGSCFPKDVKALIHMAAKSGVDAALLNAVDDRNNRQKHRLFEKIVARLGPDLSGKTFAVWGLAFKPGTDDMREAPSLVLIEHLLAAGAKVQAHDPVANDAAAALLPHDLRQRGRISFHAHQYEALEGADALALVTEWKPFRNPDFKAMGRTMAQRIIFDGRNQYDPKLMEQFDFEYFGIGRGLTI
jgi:UDPglucose 6-dehydrogenase